MQKWDVLSGFAHRSRGFHKNQQPLPIRSPDRLGPDFSLRLFPRCFECPVEDNIQTSPPFCFKVVGWLLYVCAVSSQEVAAFFSFGGLMVALSLHISRCTQKMSGSQNSAQLSTATESLHKLLCLRNRMPKAHGTGQTRQQLAVYVVLARAKPWATPCAQEKK